MPSTPQVKSLQRSSNNVVKTYFKNGNLECNQHVGIHNLEVLNSTIYKLYVKTTVKLFNKSMIFRSHLHIKDGTSAPLEEVLKDFGFLDVNRAIARAMTAIAN